ncbi:MAG TPA: DUF4328 domain-containing protein [Polyangia bacterium]|nr:DUF4328 domain-containing protein [Polyangia bacterium]
MASAALSPGYQSPRERGLAVAFNLWIGLLIRGLWALWYGYLFVIVNLGRGRWGMSHEVSMFIFKLQRVLGPLAKINLVLTAILFLSWFYRVHKNLAALGDRAERTPRWAVGCFFVPILNLTEPYKAMKEAWLLSDAPPGAPELQAGGGVGHWQAPRRLTWWWGAWLLANFTLTWAGAFHNITFSLLGSVLRMAAAVLLIGLVRDLGQRQDHKWKLLTETPPGEGPYRGLA